MLAWRKGSALAEPLEAVARIIRKGDLAMPELIEEIRRAVGTKTGVTPR